MRVGPEGMIGCMADPMTSVGERGGNLGRPTHVGTWHPLKSQCALGARDTRTERFRTGGGGWQADSGAALSLSLTPPVRQEFVSAPPPEHPSSLPRPCVQEGQP